MATVVGARGALATERLFFLGMAFAIAATVFAGFGLDFYRGDAVLGELPWQVHAHALVFSSWILFYLVQNWLVASGRVGLHRRLGPVGAVLLVLMVGLGISATLMAIQRHAVPPFFPPGIFLVLDGLGILVFGALAATALAMRRRADWHKRLMLCATILVMSPALGRILPMSLLGALAPFAVFATLMAYWLVAVGFDLATRRRVHPAYWWGGGVLTLFQLSVGPLGFSPPVLAWAAALAA